MKIDARIESLLDYPVRLRGEDDAWLSLPKRPVGPRPMLHRARNLVGATVVGIALVVDADGGRWHVANLPPVREGVFLLMDEDIARVAWDDGRYDACFLADPVFDHGIVVGHRTIQVHASLCDQSR